MGLLGQDADQLRSAWQRGVLHDVDRILADLGSRSRELETHADEQDDARDFWTGHERIEGNDPAREAMDLHSDEVGRRIAQEHPFATNGQLADLIEQSVADGEMVVIVQSGRLVPSNSITPDAAGHPDPGAAPRPGHPQERQTS